MDEETALMNDIDIDDDENIIIMMDHDIREDIEEQELRIGRKKEKRSMRRALTPLPIVESPTETYTYASNKSTNYYYNESKNSKSNNKYNHHNSYNKGI